MNKRIRFEIGCIRHRLQAWNERNGDRVTVAFHTILFAFVLIFVGCCIWEGNVQKANDLVVKSQIIHQGFRH